LWFASHCRSFVNNPEQVANLLCNRVNSASYPQQDGKCVVDYDLLEAPGVFCHEALHGVLRPKDPNAAVGVRNRATGKVLEGGG